MTTPEEITLFPYALIDANGNVETSLMMTDEFADSERTRLQAVGYQDVVKLNEGDVAVTGQPIVPAGEAERRAAITKVDASVASQLAQGFEWPAGSGQRLSLSDHGQAKIHEAYVMRAFLVFPIRWSTLNDLSFVTIADANELEQVAVAMVQTVQAVLHAATDAKIVINNSTTPA
jgi:hypothetical protein